MPSVKPNSDSDLDTSYGNEWSEEDGFGGGDMEDGITFGHFLVSLFSSLLWIMAQYK